MKWKWFLLAVVCVACDDYSECGVSDYSEEVYINFYNIDTKAARTVKFQSMDVIFPNEGTISYQDTVGATGYIFPLDLTSNSTSFLFRQDDFTSYDLTIGYNTQARIENPDCGPIFRVTALTGSSIAFDSVAVQVTELSKNLAPHVKIYY
jgi:hypothetical protein